MEPAPPQPALKYRSSPCGAHADVGWAHWLHGQLEGLRVDADLAGRTTALEPVPGARRPAFRDREDFADGHALMAATTAVLGGAEDAVLSCRHFA